MKKYASGGMSRPAALERRRQQEYLERNPQYAEREEGLKTVYPEEFMTPGGGAKMGSNIMAAIKAGAYRNPAAKRAADKAMRERIKQAETKKDKLRATSPAKAPYKNPDRSPYEPRPQSDESSYRKGGAIRSSASKRADGIAKKGKTRGRFV